MLRMLSKEGFHWYSETNKHFYYLMDKHIIKYDLFIYFFF